jgi:iron-sulfur cluster repair protein YtfE (RIC family)
MTDNILDLLKKDHEKVAKMLEKLADTTENAIKTREEIFAKLAAELSSHEKFEEEVFYPQIKNKTENAETEDLVDEAYQEHHVVDVLLAEMKSLSVDQETWTAKLTVLKENIEHHVDEEENALFPKAKKILNSEELQEMGAQYVQAKNA